MKNNDFNSLPDMVAELKTEIFSLREAISNQPNKEPPIYSDLMNLDAAINYIRSKQIPMSKSRLYKLSSANSIPLRRTGNRLLFIKDELDTWCIEQIQKPEQNKFNNSALIQNAQKKQQK